MSVPARTTVLAAALAVLALAGCGAASVSTHSTTPAKAAPVAAASAPSLPIAGTGQTVTFSWPGSSGDGQATRWTMTVLGVHAIASGPLSGQPAGYRDFCLDLKFTLAGPLAYAQFGGQFDPQWTWKGSDGQVIGGSNTGAPVFDSAACQSLFPGSEDIAAAVTAPKPGEYVTGSEAFYVPSGPGMLWLDDGNGPALLAGIRY